VPGPMLLQLGLPWRGLLGRNRWVS
jgi:hypothetical protein